MTLPSLSTVRALTQDGSTRAPGAVVEQAVGVRQGCAAVPRRPCRRDRPAPAGCWSRSPASRSRPGSCRWSQPRFSAFSAVTQRLAEPIAPFQPVVLRLARRCSYLDRRHDRLRGPGLASRQPGRPDCAEFMVWRLASRPADDVPTRFGKRLELSVSACGVRVGVAGRSGA